MTKDEIMRLAAQVWSAGGTYIGPGIAQLTEFAALVAAKEREARQQAQREAEALRERIVKSGLELHRAVRDAVKEEREACAQLVEGASMRARFIRAGMNNEGIKPCTTAAAIRARKETK